MNPIKIVGGALVLLGVIFRAISLAYFRQREKRLPDNARAQRRFAASRRRALLYDAGFVAAGIYLIIRG